MFVGDLRRPPGRRSSTGRRGTRQGIGAPPLVGAFHQGFQPGLGSGDALQPRLLAWAGIRPVVRSIASSRFSSPSRDQAVEAALAFCGRCSPRRSSCRKAASRGAAPDRDRFSGVGRPARHRHEAGGRGPTRSSRPKMPVLGNAQRPAHHPHRPPRRLRPSSTAKDGPRSGSRRRRCGWR